MQEYIIELSKYFIAICMTLYAYECFAVFRKRAEGKRNGIYIRQNILMFSIQFFCFFTMFTKEKKVDYLFYYAFVQVFLFFVLTIVPIIFEKANRLLLNNMCMLLSIGFVVISRLALQKAIKQLIIASACLLIGLAITYIVYKVEFLKRLTWIYALLGILALGIVLILGEVTHGSKISFTISGVTFQPSEIVKIIFVFFLAAALCESISLKRIISVTVVSAIYVIVLVVSKDLGSALIFFIAFVFMVFIATKNYWYLFAGAVAGVTGSVAAYHIFDHVKIRVLAWQDPWSYIDNQGFQITQSLFAIGSGNWFGMGLFGGIPSDIPFVEADFIFSAICEELGVVFGLCLILICISSFIMMMNISVRQKDSFYQLISAGVGVIYIFQIFLTIGGGTKFIPLTGVTLPLVSYGGSSVLTTMIMFFVVQGIYVRRQQEGGSHNVSQKRRPKLQTNREEEKRS